jgi:hypothetical protein
MLMTGPAGTDKTHVVNTVRALMVEYGDEHSCYGYSIYIPYYLSHCYYTIILLYSLYHSTYFLTYPFISHFIINPKTPFLSTSILVILE